MTGGITRRVALVTVCATALSLLLTGCGESAIGTTGAAGHVFTEADNGRTVKVRTGDVVKVQLAENPSTGHRWRGILTTGLAALASSYTPDDPSGEQVGSGGVHTWTMQVEQAGEHRFVASYLPPGSCWSAR